MLELSDRKWADFKVGDLMTLKVARSNDKGKLEVGTVPFVGRSNDNNGLQGFYDAPNVTQGKCITLGMVGTFRAFWQENDFAASQNILTLRATWLNKYTALFICNCIETAIAGKYSYGKSIKAGTFGDTVLSLPVDDNGQLDYDFMEQYIAEREPDYSWATGSITEYGTVKLTDREWKEFKVKDIVSFTRGKRVNKSTAEKNKGAIPLISGGDENNGMMCMINDELSQKITHKDSCMTVSSYGSSGSVHYHGYECCVHDNALAMNLKYTKNDNHYTNLFIVTILKKLKDNYAYGRPVIADRYGEEIISLPVNAQGQPDYEFMEAYIKSLPFSKVLE